MLWLRTVVDLTFLLLAVLLITVLLRDMKVNDNSESVAMSLEALRLDINTAMSKNIEYIDGRLGKLGEIQDKYQTSTTSRMYLLEQKIERLEKDNKQNTKIINTISNTNTNTVNGRIKEQE